MELQSHFLFLNGAIVIFIGLLSGIPLRFSIIKIKNETINYWRVTHAVLITDGMLLLIVGLIIPYITLSAFASWLLVRSFVVSGYSFVIAFVIGSWKGIRGLTHKPYGLNTFLFVFHFIGALGSLIGIVIVIIGCLGKILC